MPGPIQRPRAQDVLRIGGSAALAAPEGRRRPCHVTKHVRPPGLRAFPARAELPRRKRADGISGNPLRRFAHIPISSRMRRHSARDARSSERRAVMAAVSYPAPLLRSQSRPFRWTAPRPIQLVVCTCEGRTILSNLGDSWAAWSQFDGWWDSIRSPVHFAVQLRLLLDAGVTRDAGVWKGSGSPGPSLRGRRASGIPFLSPSRGPAGLALMRS